MRSRSLLLGEAGIAILALYFGTSFYPDFWQGAGWSAYLCLGFWTLAAGSGWWWALRSGKGGLGSEEEAKRWWTVALAGLFLLRGFARYTLHGAGDALWYATMLADAVRQVRAGFFPLWVGQSIYQFNGAIYPLRVAPAFHYLGVILDLLTFHSLGIFALQNLMLTLIGLAGILSAYVCLASLLPERRWLAAGLAVLFLACPGVVGIAYNTDLFMSWTTLPWVPVVWFATVRSFQDGGSPRSLILLGLSLGLCWWGHSPIALWMTGLAGLLQLVRLIVERPLALRSWVRAGAAAGVLLAVAAYPIGSVLLYPPAPADKAYAFQVATATNVSYFLRSVFPAVFLPLSRIGRQLGDFQLGYGLWAVFLFGFFLWGRSRSLPGRCLLAAAAVVAILLAPIPGLNLALWKAVPTVLRNTTGNWAMNRLYLVLAGAVVFGVAALADRLTDARPHRSLATLVVIGCVWSGAEASKFVRGSVAGAYPPSSAVDLLRPENVTVTRFAYFVFPQLPAYFSHGAVDPALENRLWPADGTAPFQTNLGAARRLSHAVASLTFAYDLRGANYVNTPRVHLDAGMHYLLEFSYLDELPRLQGTLEIVGESLHREYGLPEYGAADSFGAGGTHSNLIPLETSRPDGEDILLRFYPPDAGNPAVALPFARVTVLAYDSSQLPVRMYSWLPYRAKVSSPAAAWLETPRMFQSGYHARVDGRRAPIRRSPQGLVMVQVPPGASEVVLSYRAPVGLQLLFWVSIAAILGAFTLRLRMRLPGARPAAAA